MKKKVIICMGSSCFSRGNNQNLEFIKEFADKHALEVSIELIGHLCQNNCSKGPTIKIDDKEFWEVTPSSLPKILEKVLLK